MKFFMPEHFKSCHNHLTRVDVTTGRKVLYDTNKTEDFRLEFALLKYSSSVEYTQRLLLEYLNNVTLFTRVPGLQVFNNVLIVNTLFIIKVFRLFKSRANHI